MKIIVNGEIKKVFSVRKEIGKVYVKFSENGKEYGYLERNIQVVEDNPSENFEPIFYTYKSNCYKCGGEMDVITYVVFLDNPKENVVFPWDKIRLLNSQDIWAHLKNPSIEYYGLKVIGDIEELDEMLMMQYPTRIKEKYSKTQNRSYPMNICPHCGMQKGWYFVYREINEKIKEMKPLQTIN